MLEQTTKRGGYSSLSLVSELGRILLDIDKLGYMSLASYRKLDNLIQRDELTQNQASWMARHQSEIRGILGDPYIKAMLQQAFHSQSKHISKLIKDSQIPRVSFYRKKAYLQNPFTKVPVERPPDRPPEPAPQQPDTYGAKDS